MALDREDGDNYTLNFTASDHGNPKLTSRRHFSLEIIIDDVNDNTPLFNNTPHTSHYNFDADESLPVGSVVGVLTISDADIGENAVIEIIFRNCLRRYGHLATRIFLRTWANWAKKVDDPRFFF